MSQQPRVSIPRHRPGVPTQTPLLDSSTITFFASWRGQLMICGVAILLGGICFVLQEPYAKFRRRRREAISKAREKELISMESIDKVDPAADEVKEREKKGKEKRKDVKKRKGSLLRVPSAANLPGPRQQTRPACSQVALVIMRKRPELDFPLGRLIRPPILPRPTLIRFCPVSNPARALPRDPHHPIPSPHPLSPDPLDPRDLPLPVSPMAGPSRLSFANGDNDLESIDGDSGSTSESVSSNNMTGEAQREKPKPTPPLNFSIIPEEGYLPVQTPQTTSTKKKKRKGRTAPPGSLPPTERRSIKTNTLTRRAHLGLSGWTRLLSLLTRPPNADLEALLTERERTIESLRAERLKGDFERARKASQRSDHESRKREGELNARLSHVSSQFTAALHRINVLESMFRESGQPFPPVSPGLAPGPPGHSPGLAPGLSPGPLPNGHLQPMPSPLPPASPFAMGFGPSPRAVSGGFVPYPSPAMYPSPMLHPHFGHPPNPSPLPPFRRASMTGVDEPSLAGPLTPGHPTANGSGIFPFDLGIMPAPSPAQPMPNGNGPLSAADLRRMSIESSVMKKKKEAAKSGSESGEDSSRGLEALPDVDETGSVHGLGMGELDVGGSEPMQRGGANGESGSGSSHPSSPSPPTRASMLLTPGSIFLHQPLIQGAETPEEFGAESVSDVSEIKMIPDAENGNLYYTRLLDAWIRKRGLGRTAPRRTSHEKRASTAWTGQCPDVFCEHRAYATASAGDQANAAEAGKSDSRVEELESSGVGCWVARVGVDWPTPYQNGPFFLEAGVKTFEPR
ncbi:hypothetical protein DB88DRAFT_475820 [Papiliotrema laurentii]|uniref:Uncharacterized protein n=1 Tax=Papiliotrema laurentii TaxID=5418 RepID=A0AAD9FM95_PAPLA|nr:hypothetical protein DB88DRAFT_475820 [Papiliotrema laurentii]